MAVLNFFPIYIADDKNALAVESLIKRFPSLGVIECPQEYPFVLWFERDVLSLRQQNKKDVLSICVDWSKRRYLHVQQDELIAKAVGVKPYFPLQVLDATAGLGRDAFVLASLGCSVIMCERSMVIAALLEDGLRRALKDVKLKEAAQRMTLHYEESRAYLKRLPLAQQPDVITLDPMFPARCKSALVKKESQVLQAFLGEDQEVARDLFLMALQNARKRVVVKRPRGAPPLDLRRPDFQVQGKACRFDVYLILQKLLAKY